MNTAETKRVLKGFVDRVTQYDCPLTVAIQAIRKAPDPCQFCENNERERELVRAGFAFAARDLPPESPIAQAAFALLAAQETGDETPICPFQNR